jgi:cell division protease FtsH
MGDDTARIIDEEIRSMIDRNYQRSEKILKEHMDVLHSMTDALMKYETIDAHQIDALMAGEKVPAPKDWVDMDDDNDADSSMPDEKEKKDSSKDGSIGGPAGQH